MNHKNTGKGERDNQRWLGVPSPESQVSCHFILSELIDENATGY